MNSGQARLQWQRQPEQTAIANAAQLAHLGRASRMGLLPVIQRELRAASRRTETWRVRLAFGIGAVGALIFALLLPDINPTERGQVTLLCLVVSGFILCLFAGPYLTGDSVSWEKREGTLGLLFLTPLNGWHIVTGKMLTHSLQVSYALVGAFPLFFLSLMLGGVLWTEVARLVLVLLLTLILSLACGIFWSTMTKEARNAVLVTIVTMLLLTLLPLSVWFFERLITRRSDLTGLPQLSPMTALIFAFESNFRLRGAGLPGVSSGAFIYWGCVGLSLACSVGLLGASGGLLPWIWRRGEAGEKRAKPAKIAAASARARVPAWAPALGHAPLVWLAARDLSEPTWLKCLRSVVLVFFILMLFVALATSHWREGYMGAFFTAYGWHLITRIQLMLAATRRLHEERRNGVLEALLATPVTDAELTAGHHLSLKRAFRGPLFVLLCLNGALQLMIILFPDRLHMQGGAGSLFTVFWVGGALITLADFAVLRWLGLCEALRSPTQLKAAGRTFAWLFGGAWLAFGAAILLAVQFRSERQAAVVFALWFIACLLYDGLLVYRCLRWLAPGFRRRAVEGASNVPRPLLR